MKIKGIFYFSVLDLPIIFVQQPNKCYMKKLLFSLMALLLFAPSLFSQDSYIRSGELGLSLNIYDLKTAQRIRSSSLSTVLSNKQWAKLGESSPGLGIHYFKGIKKNIDFAGSFSGAFMNFPIKNKSFGNDKLFMAFDAAAQFKLLSEKYWLQPFGSLGVGAHKYRSYWGAFIPIGLGMNLDFFNESKFFFTSQYRVPVTTGSSNYHFFHAVGITGRIGKKREANVIPPPPPPPVVPKDSDGDGITDDKDKCPTVPGVAKYDGCPVPDTDKDGINDDDDKCPTVAGLAKYQGCPIPDTDKDGINDEEDKCPTVAGVARYQGCPIPDTDKDGINDEEDKCPTVPGVASQQGCPEITDEVKKTLSYAEKNVYFAFASTKLLSKSFAALNEVVKILNDNSSLKLKISGHTDNIGSEEYNIGLSNGRAGSVKAYLVGKGVDASRLESEGFGESEPVVDNKTAAGRQLNRRVEMKIYY